ncbi:MAG: OsmC family protein [Bacteroidetes bacterium]|nr:OsmC family protein [Bacteroidota bacterium]
MTGCDRTGANACEPADKNSDSFIFTARQVSTYMKTTTTWVSDHHFNSQQEGQVISMDGNLKNGMSPKALLLSGVAGCSGVDVVDILQKMRVPFSQLEIIAEVDQTDEHPRVFKDISITYRLDFVPADEEKVRKAIDLSLEKYCGVAAMLRKNSPIVYTLERI